MLYSKQRNTISKLTYLLIFSALFSLYSCMPTSTAPGVKSGDSVENPDNNSSTPTYQEPTYPLTGTFVQEGALQTKTNFTLPVDFADSFLIRGDALSKYLRSLPNVVSTKFCLAGKFDYIPGSNRFLVMSAKPKSFTDLINKTTEFYLQVEPSNDTANQNDCLNYNLTNVLYSNVDNPSLSFSLNQLCANCSSSVTSSGLRLYFINGQEVPVITVSSLIMTIAGSTSGSVSSCSESNACKARGFDCCLQSQCVNDGALRPGAMTLPGFLAAQEDVRLNPARYVIYPQYYFVCETRPEDPSDDGQDETGDPEYEAAVRLMELKQLYDCINKVDGEFSHCTLKYPDAVSSMPGVFSADTDGYKDDINFSALNPNLGIGDKANNIVRIIYGGQTVYEQNETPLPAGSDFVTGTVNDDLTKSQGVNLNLTLPSNAKDANLYITYKIDGTCERISSTLSKCVKTYIQSSSETESTMWHDSSKVYKLPAYADASSTSNIIVKIGGIVVPEDSTTWTKGTSPNRIIFSGSYAIYQNQTIEITYYVKTNAAELIKLKTAAQERVNSMCSCAAGNKCNLKPLMDTNNSSVVNYECTYPTQTSDQPPVNQTVYVSNKNIAHRYFDTNGVSYDEDYGSALPQELNPFSYTNNNVLKPNNVNQYVGFNEIYGSFAKTGTYVSRPAKMVKVKKDQQYDILVNSGAFSSCTTCGADYYASLQKIFPQNFGGQGGGYAPDNFESRRLNNQSLYRSDDLLYGRACFVPATMIPWTHVTSSTPRDQRRARLTAQHLLFANGYNRDWYGFDYGSLIGSFDGVTWFSIGNQRRIKATTNRLYLAVNAYLGDLNVDGNFNVSVSESSIFSSAIADHDTETDGAQCQKSHYCSNDNDCFRQLGYDYTCQNVGSLLTPWPQFDTNASEVVGSSVKSLLSLVGGSNGQSKRCVYRGRGAPCLQNLDLASSGNNFSSSTSVGTLTCSPNNSCLPLTTAGRFNDRIARFANSPVAQNIAEATATPGDTIGLGARIILRPYDYYGTQSVPSAALTALNTNKVNAICVPGKDINTAVDNYDLNARHPSNRTDTSDKLYGVGTTSPSTQNLRALNACPATDDAGNSLQLFDLPLGDPTLNRFTITQNMSSNLLNVTPFLSQNIFSSQNGNQVTTVGYQKNACLRAPGSSCFSDMECAPSEFIATKAKSAASALSDLLSVPEAKFWQEELVCGNPDFKFVAPGSLNPNFDLKKNRCCREFGKTMTVYTQTATSDWEWCDTTSNTPKVAGVNTSISSPTRYSRVHTAYDKMTCNRDEVSTTKSFALSLVAPGAADRWKQVLRQYNTLDTINQRTCCTTHWVRKFSTENGGGNAFAKSKMQNIDREMFKHMSWGPDDESSIVPTVNDPAFECDRNQFNNASCEIKSLTPAEEENYLTWAGTLELIGIPQVAIKTNDQIFKQVNDLQQDISGSNLALTDSEGRKIFLESSLANADFIDDTTKRYYSAANYTRMNMPTNGLKKVFSEDEFNCCIPSGQEIPSTSTSSQCCTGFAAEINGPKRCCLPDFTDVTVYLNRYVSSEGRGLPDSAYDPATGYIKNPGTVQLLAAQKNLCCSGRVMTGVAISQLPIPLRNGEYLPPDTANTTRRFAYRTDEFDNAPETGSVGSIFDAGVRWNNHVYCVPESLAP